METSLEEYEKRDTKGLYKKAKNGDIKNFTGVSSPYDVPENPDFTAKTEVMGVEEIFEGILGKLEY